MKEICPICVEGELHEYTHSDGLLSSKCTVCESVITNSEQMSFNKRLVMKRHEIQEIPMTELKNNYHYIDHTSTVLLDQKSYLYSFFLDAATLGNSTVIIAAPSFHEASLFFEKTFSLLKVNTYDVYLIGVDLEDYRGNRIILQN